MNAYLYLAVYLAGLASGIALCAWILHCTDKRLAAGSTGKAAP
jgi:hypothetical protein